MLDASKVGALISRLRKDRDMTQMELAEQLAVSHQAVSKWERGESMPDIGTLPVLGRLFGVTVDDLLEGEISQNRERHLGSRGTLIEELAGETPDSAAELINEGQADLKDLVDVAPIVRTSTLEKVTDHLHPGRLNAKDVANLAPYLHAEALDQLVQGCEEEEWGWELVVKLAPFLRKSTTLARLVDKTIDGRIEPEKIIKLAPFLGRQDMDRLVGQVELGSLEWEYVWKLAPYLGKDTLNRLAEGCLSGTLAPEHLHKLAPFLHKEVLGRMISTLGTSALTPKIIKRLAPFLDRDTLSEIVMSGLLENYKEKATAE